MTEDLNKLRELAKSLREYAKDCADARYYGGPTMLPKFPVGEGDALPLAKSVEALLSRLQDAEERGKPMLREAKLSDHGWLPIVLCPTDGVDRRLMLPDGTEVIGAYHKGGLGQSSGWKTKKAIQMDFPVYEERRKGGFIPDFIPRPRPPELELKQTGTQKRTVWVVGKLPEGVYPTHFRPNDTVHGNALSNGEA